MTTGRLAIASLVGYFATMNKPPTNRFPNRQLASRLLAIATALMVFQADFAVADEPSCVPTTRGVASMAPGTIRLLNDNNTELSIDVLVADDNFERASGFQHICPDVINEVFILFVYDAAIPGRFHMQNVHAPLDIAFLDARGRVIDVQLMRTYTESDKPLYGPGVPFQFALEARAGFFAEHGVSAVGSRLVMGAGQ